MNPNDALKDLSLRGLYSPATEHDSCGVGMVANIKGVKSHQIIDESLEVLVNLGHRGACGCDPDTGDGAGILIQMPHQFFQRVCPPLGINLPELGEYGAGVVFLPPQPEARIKCERLIEQVIQDEGLELLGWREVPLDPTKVGRDSRAVMPSIKQVFVRQETNGQGQSQLERKLYVTRKVIENSLANCGLSDEEADYFYICSLSCNTLVYKGLLMSHQVTGFYLDLAEADLVSAFALVHSRFSTNTLGHWKLAHPYRYLAHNGEINTVRGNVNWMHAREAQFESKGFGDDINKISPVMTPGASDTACFDNALELLLMTGRDLSHSMLMMIPEAWGQHESMSQEKKDFYEYHSCLMEPWDGPAMMVAANGHEICAVLDRNGLRPFRYTLTHDDKLVMASETGVLDLPPASIKEKGRLQPGRMFLVSLDEGRIIGDEELKHTLSNRQPYGQWLEENKVALEDLPVPAEVNGTKHDLAQQHQAFGYTVEELRMITTPMAATGYEPVGSMGNDAALAVLSDQNHLLFNYFKQLFAQVTNPPLDSIREELVTSTEGFIGRELNLFEETPQHCRQLRLKSPIISSQELEQIRQNNLEGLKAITLSTLFDAQAGTGSVPAPVGSMKRALDRLCNEASQAIADGYAIIILSDRGVDSQHAPIPSLLATGAVHHHLIRQGARTKAGLVVESGEPREVHHFALLVGYGAGAVNPYLALETARQLSETGELNGTNADYAEANFIKANAKGLVKVMSKMGISTVQSYRGAQIFEAIGVCQAVIDQYFTWTPSRVEGIGLDIIEQEARQRHHKAFSDDHVAAERDLEMGGFYQWRRDGEHHQWHPDAIAKLQFAAQTNSWKIYQEFAQISNDQSKKMATLRGLLDFKQDRSSIPIEEVEPASEIVKRFATGAVSLGSISREAHETMAIAMNRIGARSNTGEGGEDYHRYTPDANGDSRSSAIKQVASGRFGVTANYLVNATDLQIKMAQGSKPGEGGQLPGHKVDDYIGWVRRTTPGVELISPPPHHDIYSIEDLAQLIHDLKNVNPDARIHVKLVSEVGVGTIAAGVSKGHGDVVLISGHDGGTGASPESSIKYAGLPWELGVAETQQVLVANGLRGRIVVQTDGQLKTGRDVAIAALLGAEEFGIATAALVVSGCIMLRKCHLNTCSVGIATQDPELRERFAGQPEHLVNYFTFVAEELREIMAELGFRSVCDMVGRVDLLDSRKADNHWKAQGIDLSRLLCVPLGADDAATHCTEEQDHGLEEALDHQLIRLAQPALEHKQAVDIDLPIRNSNRTVGAMLSGKIAKKYGEDGLPPGTINIHLTGSAGQSFGAFLSEGIDITLNGDTNDYMGKGMGGGKIVICPHPASTFVPEDNIIIGNVALYGATGGQAFIRGRAGERFCVRNSGARTVVEGVGDHGCEYMTAGVAVILGSTGRNFAAGMSGGIAFVYDPDNDFASRFNDGMADLETVTQSEDISMLHNMIEYHLSFTGSGPAGEILENWDVALPKFKKIMPRDYRRVLDEHKLNRQLEMEVSRNE
ncbi:MAG: glutamate synthase large subunit [Chloroflexi bacterium]|nr:glutamate synthase large subunit [Chloroflexota bacterium]MDA1218361.1 glutamate synthase large subunit [Chloroflexota bacterium]PKB57465.1 MAG: glutamate synthase large subunit [SAR202 cluster bacterium Casp-Chloro-G3]